MALCFVVVACSEPEAPSSTQIDERSRVDERSLDGALNASDAGILVDHLRLVDPDDIELAEAMWNAGRGDWMTRTFEQGPGGTIRAEVSNESSTYMVVLETRSSGRKLFLYKVGPVDGDRTTWSGWTQWASGESTLAISASIFDVSGGFCEPTHSFGSAGDQSLLPLASVAKLLVAGVAMDALANQDISLAERLTIDDSVRSLPSGDWHRLRSGSTRTVEEAMLAMLAHSDNTATDMMIRRLGEATIQREAARWFGYDVDQPFFTSSELFKLKWARGGLEGRRYVSASSLEERREILDSLASTDLPLLTGSESPSFVTDIAWRATSSGVCRALLRIRESADLWPHLQLLMGPPDPTAYPAPCVVKFGNEPGVFSAAGVAEGTSGDRVIVLSIHNPDGRVDLVEAEQRFRGLVAISVAE